jgi:hypothetical protein
MEKEKFIDDNGKEIYEISCKTVYKEEDLSPHIVCNFTLKNIDENWVVNMKEEDREEFITDAFYKLKYFLRGEIGSIKKLNEN